MINYSYIIFLQMHFFASVIVSCSFRVFTIFKKNIMVNKLKMEKHLASSSVIYIQSESFIF